MFFDIDHPALHEHLDAVAGTFSPLIPGSVGRRWAQTFVRRGLARPRRHRGGRPRPQLRRAKRVV